MSRAEDTFAAASLRAAHDGYNAGRAGDAVDACPYGFETENDQRLGRLWRRWFETGVTVSARLAAQRERTHADFTHPED